jgi:hypothetical protein
LSNAGRKRGIEEWFGVSWTCRFAKVFSRFSCIVCKVWGVSQELGAQKKKHGTDLGVSHKQKCLALPNKWGSQTEGLKCMKWMLEIAFRHFSQPLKLGVKGAHSVLKDMIICDPKPLFQVNCTAIILCTKKHCCQAL